jgi:hypothetical protein
MFFRQGNNSEFFRGPSRFRTARVRGKSESEIHRALCFFDRPARNAMGINHRGPDVGMTERLLDRVEVVARLQKVRRIRMAESMRRDDIKIYREGAKDARKSEACDEDFYKLLTILLIPSFIRGTFQLSKNPNLHFFILR